MARFLSPRLQDPGALAAEAGFTLIETLVMLAVSALIAALVLPLSSRGVRDNFRLADRALLAGDYAASEAEYRRLLRQAAPPLMRPDGSTTDTSLVGISTAVRFPVESEQARGCSRLAGYGVVRLRVAKEARGGRLLCEIAGGSYTLLEWTAGEVSFQYSRDGATWHDSWPLRRRRDRPDSGAPPLVRMSLRQGSHNRLLWVERAGDPALRDPTTAGAGYGAAQRGRRL